MIMEGRKKKTSPKRDLNALGFEASGGSFTRDSVLRHFQEEVFLFPVLIF